MLCRAPYSKLIPAVLSTRVRNSQWGEVGKSFPRLQQTQVKII